jgi:hypothetical protein
MEEHVDHEAVQFNKLLGDGLADLGQGERSGPNTTLREFIEIAQQKPVDGRHRLTAAPAGDVADATEFRRERIPRRQVRRGADARKIAAPVNGPLPRKILP